MGSKPFHLVDSKHLPSQSIVNDCIEAAIDGIATEDWHYAKDCLRQLASWFKGCGATREEFAGLCGCIESWGVSRVDDPIQREEVRLKWREFYHVDRLKREYEDQNPSKIIVIPEKVRIQ